MNSELTNEQSQQIGEQQLDFSILQDQKPTMMHFSGDRNPKKVDSEQRVDTYFDKRDRKYLYHQHFQNQRNSFRPPKDHNNRNFKEFNSKKKIMYRQKKPQYRPKEEVEKKSQEKVSEVKECDEALEDNSNECQKARSKIEISGQNESIQNNNDSLVSEFNLSKQLGPNRNDSLEKEQLKQHLKEGSPCLSSPERQYQTQVLNIPIQDQFQIIQVKMVIEQPEVSKPKKQKKAKNNKIVVFETKAAHEQLEIVPQKKQTVKISLPSFDIKKYLQCNFRRVIVAFLFKGNIKLMRIKKFIVNPYDKVNINVSKDRLGNCSIDDKHKNYIKMFSNCYRGNHDYISNYQSAQLDLCQLRLPESAVDVEVFTGGLLRECPIEIDRLTIICGCSKKYELLVCSKGVSCPECSNRFEITLESITLN